MIGYPLVTEALVEEAFLTSAATKANARDHFGAEAGEYATKCAIVSMTRLQDG
ncbi:hypothetical protein [Sphingomonas sp. LaA6.9]|uniref:hypothetical protein n=1 Tax=Sphingomonas sp. LaA6.9 TaxID=2919914 RepID=UPI001F500B04|nr:hypothetical protein [Sphingomonas sp. LaA6.9]MCJ8157474.1 hypothetical protein [Sphingomonas sp. LaA6.9]